MYSFLNGKWLLLLLLGIVMVIPAPAMGQAPTTDDLYKMVIELQKKADRLQREAEDAREEAAKTKEELARIKQQLEDRKASDQTEKPRKAVESVSPAPISRAGLQREKGGLTASYEYLLWKPSLSQLDFALDDPDTDDRMDGKTVEIEPDMDAGHRLTLGYNLPNKQLDFRVKWTDYKTDASSGFNLSGQIWGLRLHADSIIDENDATSASASYNLKFSLLDLEVGYAQQLTDRADLRIFGGIREAQINQRYYIKYIENPPGRIVEITEENNLTGYGLRIGLESNYYFGKGFSLFTGGAASMLFGEMEYRVAEYSNGPNNQLYDISKEFDSHLIPALEFDIGVSWEHGIGKKGAIIVAAGYHFENWFNVYQQYRFVDDVDPSLASLSSSDLGLHGPYFKLTAAF